MVMRTRPGVQLVANLQGLNVWAWTPGRWVRSATRHGGEGGGPARRARCPDAARCPHLPRGGQPTPRPSCPRRVAPGRSPREPRRDVTWRKRIWVPGFCPGPRLWLRGLLASLAATARARGEGPELYPVAGDRHVMVGHRGSVATFADPARRDRQLLCTAINSCAVQCRTA